MVHPDSHKVSRAPWYSGTELEGTSSFAYGAVTLFGGTFQWPSTRRVLGSFLACAVLRPAAPREPKPSRFGLFRFRSPLLTESRLLSFPPGTEMVHFPGFASPCL